jgi:hypothetical protein
LAWLAVSAISGLTVGATRVIPHRLAVKVPVRNWHPISKLAILLGLAGIVVVWWTDRSGTGEPGAVSGRSAQAEAVAPSSLRATGTVDARPLAMTAAAALPLASRVLPPEATIEAMVTRPLFAPDRRPYDPEVQLVALPVQEATPESGPNRPVVRFIGSIEEEGRLRAVVSDGFNVRAIAAGDEVDGWMVLDVEPRRLTLGLDDEHFELTIFE